MSFFSNFHSDKCPGPIGNNPLAGLSEKVCIQADKVFDACIKQTQQEGFTLTLSNIVPETPTYPLTFISGRSTSSVGAVSNLSIDRESDGKCARVSATVTIPVQIAFVDAAGVDGTAEGSIAIPMDVLLYIPSPAIVPVNISAIVSAVLTAGTFVNDTTFTVNTCTTVILKVTMPVDLLVPTYGYCVIPPAQDYSREVCAGFFELPLYPQSRTCPK